MAIDIAVEQNKPGRRHDDVGLELFARGEVAGAPPDRLSATGQRWGNPLYDWPAQRATGYRWGRETGTNPWLGGLAMTLIGAALVGIAKVLGG